MQLKNSLNKAFEKIKAIFELIGVFVEWLLADVTCKYGTNWKRPICLWLTVVFLCAFLFWIGNGIAKVDGSAAPSWLESLYESLYFSIVTITTLGYGDYRPKPGCFQFLASFEAAFGMFMWAIFIAVFARKYMR